MRGITRSLRTMVGRTVADLLERLLAVAGRFDRVTPAANQLLQSDALRRIVFDDQNAVVCAAVPGPLCHAYLVVDSDPGPRGRQVDAERAGQAGVPTTRCRSAHSASTCDRSVWSAPIEMRAIHRPSSSAGVR